MIRHVAVFRFKPEFTEAQRLAWIDMVADLPNHIDQIRSMSIGVDILQAASSYDVGLVADFDSLDDLATYSNHPKHQAVLDVSGPVKEHLATADFEI
ncbi:Dabb family protein [Arthrobacter sulfonylureivorans]|uniref:Dabb family protein n=1 Tax=Arthrobacter sulfonylureivorans TaxID=2486855 RepID=UPI0039E609D4